VCIFYTSPLRVMRVVLLLSLLVCIIGAAAGVSLRGQQDSLQHFPAPQANEEGPLISFLQQHQRAYASLSSESTSSAFSPSQQAQAAAQQTVPAGANEVSADGVLSAVENASHQPHHTHALVQTGAAVAQGVGAGAAAGAKALAKGPGEDGDGEDFGPCKTCVFVLERIKKGSNMLLPAICSELYHKYPDAYALCHQVLNALSINGNNVRYWLFEGCFKYEIYQSKEWIKPCPSHVMCSVLKDLSAEPFCPALPMENPFEGGSE